MFVDIMQDYVLFFVLVTTSVIQIVLAPKRTRYVPADMVNVKIRTAIVSLPTY